MFFFFQAEDGIRDGHVTGVQTCALPICGRGIVMRSLRGGNFWGGLPKRKILLSSAVGNRVRGHGALARGAGYLTRSVGTADRPAATSVLVHRHARDRIVNVWLIFIVFVGVMIAVADGLTRVSIFDREEAWNGPFEYVPY